MINEALILYIFFMIIASVVSTYGTFVTLPYEHIPQWDAIKMALPYAWIDWLFLTIAIKIGKEHELVTPLQMKFSITMFKFFLVLLFTKYYLGKNISRSDIVGFIIVVLAYFMNISHFISKYIFKIDVPEHGAGLPATDQPGHTGPNTIEQKNGSDKK
jgi:hypothetical protein